MKKIVRLTESDLTRIVKRVLKETEEDSKDTQCKSKMESKEFAQKAIDACKGYSDDCVKLGTKTMYPKTYDKLKSYNSGTVGIGIGCVENDGDGLVFYETYTGWLNLLNINCGDEIITIPKVPQSIKNFCNDDAYDSVNYLIHGDSIYLYRWGGC